MGGGCSSLRIMYEEKVPWDLFEIRSLFSLPFWLSIPPSSLFFLLLIFAGCGLAWGPICHWWDGEEGGNGMGRWGGGHDRK